jgi:hypothetical protein
MMDQQVISKQPALCLIEYATGDMGGQTPVAEIAGAVEGMVLKLMDANCFACFLYLYRREESFDASNPVIAEYERVAEHYGIPSLNVGRMIEDEIAAGRFSASGILRDKVHTTAEGSEITAELISAGLQIVLNAPGVTCSRSFEIPDAPLVARNYHYTSIIPAEPSMLRDPANSVNGRFRFAHSYVRIDSANEIRFIPDGDLVGLLVIVGKDAGIIEVETADSRDEYMLWDEWCTYSRSTTVIFRRHVPKGMPARMRLTSKPVPGDATSALEAPVPKRLHVSGFLVRT